MGKVSREVAVTLAEKEFEKFNVTQDKLLISDFDRMAKKLVESEKKK